MQEETKDYDADSYEAETQQDDPKNRSAAQ